MQTRSTIQGETWPCQHRREKCTAPIKWSNQQTQDRRAEVLPNSPCHKRVGTYRPRSYFPVNRPILAQAHPVGSVSFLLSSSPASSSCYPARLSSGPFPAPPLNYQDFGQARRVNSQVSVEDCCSYHPEPAWLNSEALQRDAIPVVGSRPPNTVWYKPKVGHRARVTISQEAGVCRSIPLPPVVPIWGINVENLAKEFHSWCDVDDTNASTPAPFCQRLALRIQSTHTKVIKVQGFRGLLSLGGFESTDLSHNDLQLPKAARE